MNSVIVFPVDHHDRLKEYNKNEQLLAEKRTKFYEDNPDFPFKSMYMSVTAPPKAFILIQSN